MLTAPIAYEDDNPLSLADLYDTLPPALHAAAARGFFGAVEDEWCLDTTEAHCLHTVTHTLQLLPRLPRVTTVRLTGRDASGRTLRNLLGYIAHAMQLATLSIEVTHVTRARPAPWLRHLMPLTGLQRLEVRGCGLAWYSLPDATATIAQLRQLTALVLEGTGDGGHPISTAAAELARALLSLPVLSQLGLRSLRMHGAGMRAVWDALAGMPQLCSLDLDGTAAPQAEVTTGLAACAALTMLDLTNCLLDEGCCDCVRALCATHARLLSLSLDDNFSLGADDLCSVVSVPSLLGLTRLSLADVGLTLHHCGTQPWRQLCALTALQELWVPGNDFGDAGANALAPYISSLVQLRSLDISHCELTTSGALGAALWRLPRLLELTCDQGCEMSEPFTVPVELYARGVKLVPSVYYE